jgi:hypothetical protein
MKIITTGQMFLLNYELLSFSKQPGKFMSVFLLWDVSQTKI